MKRPTWQNWIVPPAAAALLLCGATARAQAQEGSGCPKDIPVRWQFPQPCADGQTGGVDLQAGATYAWKAFIAVNWPALAGQRGQPDPSQPFGKSGPTAWLTDRAKIELYPGNASATVPPHGVVLNGGQPANAPNFGYGESPDYIYAPGSKGVGTQDGRVQPCPGQPNVAQPAWVPLDETSQIGNNQTYAGVLPATDPLGFNTSPRLIRYAVKMNLNIYRTVVQGQYWYNAIPSPLATSTQNYTKALANGLSANPAQPFVNFTPASASDPTRYEIKSSWRPLTAAEAASGRFFTSTVRYYEKNPRGFACWRQAEWGLTGMHLITFTQAAPWGIWSTFEQADNILTADGKRVEDEDGNIIIANGASPTSPSLSSNPNVQKPVVTKSGDYCTTPGARLYFRENPFFGTLPSGGNICVNTRWHAIPAGIISTNQTAHQAIRAASGTAANPWLHYKLVNVQATPVDVREKSNARFSTPESYSMANATIETDYTLGNFTGNLVNGAPGNLFSSGPAVQNCFGGQYCNTALLPFQSNHLSFVAGPLRMGGCAGCHAFAASIGQDFSFALGGNATAPEPTKAFATTRSFRDFRRP